MNQSVRSTARSNWRWTVAGWWVARIASCQRSDAEPARRPVVETRDVTKAVAWLVSDAARHVTGLALPVDAGFVAR
jgi:enoyl-[acyl-carrier-protein] reductase (NADH)